MEDYSKIYRDFMRVSHFLRHGHADPALKVAPGQHRVLTVLVQAGERGGLAQRELGALMRLSPAALSELLAKLEERGLVVRKRSEEDRRVTLVSLTSKGEEQAKSILDAESRAAGEAFGQLGKADLAELERMLAVMVEGLRNME